MIDVLIFTNNHGIFLERCIDSVNKQTFKKINILLFDNHEFTRIPKKTLAKVDRYYHCPTIRGPSKLRNYGISKSNSEFISLIDGDDYWAKDKLEKQIKKYKELNNSIIYTRIYSVKNSKGIINNKKLHSGNIFHKLIFKEISITGSMSGIFLTKKMLNRIKKKYGFIFNPNLDYCEDFDFFIRASTLFHFNYVDEPLVYINLYNTSHQSKFGNYERSKIKYNMIIQNILNHKHLVPFGLRLLISLKAKLILSIKYVLYQLY